MPNILDYISWRGDLTFAAAEFCEVDNLILSMLSFVDYSDIVGEDIFTSPVRLSDCFAEFNKKYPNGEEFGAIIPALTNDLFRMTAESVRFRDTYVTCYREKSSETEITQFAAVTFVLPDNSVFVAFRGTDDTLNGWREDFNLSFTYPAPSQIMAVEYLTDIAYFFGGDIRCGGHSKGGHLAVYAAVFAPKPVRRRVIKAYSNDGPGFVPQVIGMPEFAEMNDSGKICAIVPQSSVIGMLLEHSENYTVVESTISNGLFQHDPFSWSVMGNSFIHKDGLSKDGKMHDAALGQWLGEMNADERREFTEILFGIIESTGAKTLSDFSVDVFGKLTAAVRAIGGMDKDTKEKLLRIVRRLADALINNRG